MTGIDIEPFLFVGSLICAAMAVISALRHKSRGVSAYIMAVAFLVLGGTMLLLRARAPQWMLMVGCAALFCLLVGDFAVRAARGGGEGTPR